MMLSYTPNGNILRKRVQPCVFTEHIREKNGRLLCQHLFITHGNMFNGKDFNISYCMCSWTLPWASHVENGLRNFISPKSQLQTDGLPGGNCIQTAEGMKQIKQRGCPSCSCCLSKQHYSCKQSVFTP